MNDGPQPQTLGAVGTILLAHGARDPDWVRPFEGVRARLAQRDAQAPVELAFLEFNAPDLTTALDRLVARGCTRIVVVPVFLGQGGHVRKDVPRLIDAMRMQHPQIAIALSPSIGEDERVLDAIADCCARHAGEEQA